MKLRTQDDTRNASAQAHKHARTDTHATTHGPMRCTRTQTITPTPAVCNPMSRVYRSVAPPSCYPVSRLGGPPPARPAVGHIPAARCPPTPPAACRRPPGQPPTFLCVRLADDVSFFLRLPLCLWSLLRAHGALAHRSPGKSFRGRHPSHG